MSKYANWHGWSNLSFKTFFFITLGNIKPDFFSNPTNIDSFHIGIYSWIPALILKLSFLGRVLNSVMKETSDRQIETAVVIDVSQKGTKHTNNLQVYCSFLFLCNLLLGETNDKCKFIQTAVSFPNQVRMNYVFKIIGRTCRSDLSNAPRE